MSLFTRNALGRGLKLTTQSFFDLFVALRTAFGVTAGAAPTIGADNYANKSVPFIVAFHVPAIYSQTGLSPALGSLTRPLAIPFLMPPLQEFFDANKISSIATPTLVLDEISVSFDQAGEPAVISGDTFAAPPTAGLLDYANVDKLKIRLSLVEKTINATSAGAPFTPQREVATIEMDGAAGLLSPFFRTNPFVLTDIGKSVDPYKSYMIMMTFDSATSVFSQRICLAALQITLKFHHPVVRRTVAGAQNAPTLTKRGQSMWQVGAPPVGNVLIDSTAAGKGVQDPFALGTNVGQVPSPQAFDVALRQGLDGGLFKDGDVPPQEALVEDAGYMVIAVPMWQNVGIGAPDVGAVCESNAVEIPWIGGGLIGPCCDRRVIQINFPFEIHHIFAMQNYASIAGTHDKAATYTTAVGVGLSSGKRGDQTNDQQVAFLSWTGAGKAPLDKIKATPKVAGNAGLSSDPTEFWDFELYAIPLVGAGGTGYVAQGTPVFVAKGNTKTSTRSNIGGAPPNTAGGETTLECLWSFGDTAGLNGAGSRVYAGVGGNWIYIIGKQMLVKPAAAMG